MIKYSLNISFYSDMLLFSLVFSYPCSGFFGMRQEGASCSVADSVASEARRYGSNPGSASSQVKTVGTLPDTSVAQAPPP